MIHPVVSGEERIKIHYKRGGGGHSKKLKYPSFSMIKNLKIQTHPDELHMTETQDQGVL